MIYGLTPGRTNCDHVFNLLCSYGNVLKVLSPFWTMWTGWSFGAHFWRANFGGTFCIIIILCIIIQFLEGNFGGKVVQFLAHINFLEGYFWRDNLNFSYIATHTVYRSSISPPPPPGEGSSKQTRHCHGSHGQPCGSKECHSSSPWTQATGNSARAKVSLTKLAFSYFKSQPFLS